VHYTTPSAISAFTNKIYKNNSSLSVIDTGKNEGYMIFKADGNIKARLNKTGLGIGTNTPTQLLSLESTNNSLIVANTTASNGHSGLLLLTNSIDESIFVDDGNSQRLNFSFHTDLSTQSNRESSTKVHITQAGEMNATNYVPFTGSHLCITKEQFNNLNNDGKNDLSEYENNEGFIVRSTGLIYNIEEHYSTSINEALPVIEYTSKINDASIYGVIVKKTNIVNCIPRLVINSIGEGAIIVSNYSGNIHNGDYITSCPLKGIGMKQVDDLLYSYTIAKALTNEEFNDNYKTVNYDGTDYRYKLVGCTYHCG